MSCLGGVADRLNCFFSFSLRLITFLRLKISQHRNAYSVFGKIVRNSEIHDEILKNLCCHKILLTRSDVELCTLSWTLPFQDWGADFWCEAGTNMVKKKKILV